MPTSDRAKGLRVEARLEVILAEAGYRVHRARAVSKQLPDFRSKPCPLCKQRPLGRFVVVANDLWGVFDLACLRADTAPLMIQACSTPSDASHRRKKLEAWTELYDFGVDIMVVTWNSRTAQTRACFRNRWRAQLLLNGRPGDVRWTSGHYTSRELKHFFRLHLLTKGERPFKLRESLGELSRCYAAEPHPEPEKP